MKFGRRRPEVEERIRERREREDAAPRLRERIPDLTALSIVIDDHLGAVLLAKTRYVRHIVVERAPALFDIPCSEPGCQDGGHDLTREVMRALLGREARFSGEDVCFGWRGRDRCNRVLHFTGNATYAGGGLPPVASGRA